MIFGQLNICKVGQRKGLAPPLDFFGSFLFFPLRTISIWLVFLTGSELNDCANTRNWHLGINTPGSTMVLQEKSASGSNSGRVNMNWHLFGFRVNAAAFAYAMTTLGSCMINNVFSFYYVKLFVNKFKISEGAFHQSQVSESNIN